MAKLVSKTYGDALFEVALEKNQLDEFLDEVKAAQTTRSRCPLYPDKNSGKYL